LSTEHISGLMLVTAPEEKSHTLDTSYFLLYNISLLARIPATFSQSNIEACRRHFPTVIRYIHTIRFCTSTTYSNTQILVRR